MSQEVFLSSPCIGFCSTTYGDDFCKGCYRHFQTVIQWETLSDDKKNEFYQKISMTTDKIFSQYVQFSDKELFDKVLDEFSIEHSPEYSLSYALLRLLQKHSLSLKDRDIGCQLKEKKTWSEFYMMIDKKLYQQVIAPEQKNINEKTLL